MDRPCGAVSEWHISASVLPSGGGAQWNCFMGGQPMSDPAIGSNNRILVIDDNPSIHVDFRKILAGSTKRPADLEELETALFGSARPAAATLNFQIDSAYQGNEGLAMVERALAEGQPYALAFVDVRMPPGWDGIETVTRIWERYPELQVVICTAYSDYSWEQMSAHLGQSDSVVILKKPFDNIEVLQLAHAMTKKWLLARQGRLRLEDLDRMVHARTEELQAANVKLQQEITVRAKAEADLRSSEERFERAFVNSPIPMAIQALKDERYLDLNASYAQLVGVVRERVVGHTPEELGIGLNAQVRAEILQRARDKSSVRNRECEVQPQSGKPRQVRLFVESFQLGTEVYMLVLAQDVTEQTTLESQLRQAQKMEAVGQLAAGIAHDFNNLLTVIQGHANLRLASQSLDQEIASSLKEIAAASERASQLTRQLLAFSRHQLVHRQPVDLNQLVRDQCPVLRQLVGEHIALRCELAPDLPFVEGDSTSLEQAVVNLSLNARDAMSAGGELTLRTEVSRSPSDDSRESAPRHVCLSVEDTGCGIDDATQARIFEPFFTTKEIGSGTGMGLAIVYGIVRQHEGWIQVQSAVGKGSAIKVFLPAVPVEHSPNAEQSSSRRQTILVVEAEPELQQLVHTILEKEGYRVVIARNGVEALQAWERLRGKIDLLLTDRQLPEGMSGERLAQQLQRENDRLKILYSGGYLGGKSASKPVDVITQIPKPYHPQKLLKAVRALLNPSN